MYGTYYVTSSSLVLPHGTFLKGQAVTLPNDLHTQGLVDAGLLALRPQLKESKKRLSPNTPEDKQLPLVIEQLPEEIPEVKDLAPVDEQPEIAVQSEEEIIPELEELLEEPTQRKKRHGRRKHSTERPS